MRILPVQHIAPNPSQVKYPMMDTIRIPIEAKYLDRSDTRHTTYNQVGGISYQGTLTQSLKVI
jgi:hypothetical protein